MVLAHVSPCITISFMVICSVTPDGVFTFTLMFYLAFVTHIVGCMFAWISLGSEGPTWYSEATGVTSTSERYVASIYWAYATMATVGKTLVLNEMSPRGLSLLL